MNEIAERASSPVNPGARRTVIAIALGAVPAVCWLAMGLYDPEAWGSFVLACIWGAPLPLGWWYPGWAAGGLIGAALLGIPLELFAAAWVGSVALFVALAALLSGLPLASACFFLAARRAARQQPSQQPGGRAHADPQELQGNVPS